MTKEVLRLLPTIPAAVRTSRFQAELDKQQQRDGTVFMTREETEGVLAGAGLTMESVEDIQANENWLFAARRSG